MCNYYQMFTWILAYLMDPTHPLMGELKVPLDHSRSVLSPPVCLQLAKAEVDKRQGLLAVESLNAFVCAFPLRYPAVLDLSLQQLDGL